MDCSLWFGRCRINNASEITEHFDMAALRGYFLGGSLAEWLREHGGEEQAGRLETIDPSDPELDLRLAQVFGVAAPASLQVFSGAENVRDVPAAGSYNGSMTAFGSGLAWNSGSFAGSYFGSYAGSYYGSFSGSYSGSYVGSFTKFSLWEWEWEWRFGSSFHRSYGSFGSFSGTSWRGGSFFAGSFLGGSFMLGGSFTGLGAYALGSFPMGYGSFAITADEYDRIMYECLRRCPLDCFGYGIHII